MESTKIIDLTLTICEGMLSPPQLWHPYVEITKMGRIELEGRATSKLIIGSHIGTHVDAPAHVIQGGLTIDETPLEALVGKAVVFDLTHKGERQPINPEDLKDKLQNLKGTSIVILRTGWHTRWGTPQYMSMYPYLSEEAAKLIVKAGVRTLVMDIPGPDNPENVRSGLVMPIHKILIENGVTLVEYVTNLDKITTEGVTLVALPLKVKGMDGAPARVVALEY